VIADHSSRSISVMAAAWTAAVIIPLVLALRPMIESTGAASHDADLRTR
jgi:hypothetical protein